MTRRTKRKALGQHFLKKSPLLDRIVRSIAPKKQDLVIEIGAGKGILTFALAEKAGRVIAIEKDPAFIPFLQRKTTANLKVLEKDILGIDLSELIKNERFPACRVKLVGNLPYSISSPLLFKILEEKDFFSECIFLLQREVAERVCAQPGSKSLAPLSILLQIHFSPRIHFIIPPQCFSPPPRVESALISLTKREQPLYDIKDKELFRNFLREAFQQRRKTLCNNLKRLGFPSPILEDALLKLNLGKTVRPEELSISQFVELFKLLAFPGIH